MDCVWVYICRDWKGGYIKKPIGCYDEYIKTEIELIVYGEGSIAKMHLS